MSARRPRRLRTLVALGALLAVVTGTQAVAPRPVRAQTPLTVLIQPGKVQIQNNLVLRKWRDTGTGVRTTSFQDLRTGREWIGPAGSNDFTIRVGPLTFTSSDFDLASVSQASLANG